MKRIALAFAALCAVAFTLFGGFGLVALGLLGFALTVGSGRTAGMPQIHKSVSRAVERQQRFVFDLHQSPYTGCLIPISMVAIMLLGFAFADVPGLLVMAFR